MKKIDNRAAWSLSGFGLLANVLGFAVGVLSLSAGYTLLTFVGAALMVLGLTTMTFVIVYRIVRPTGDLLDRILAAFQDQK